MRWDIISTAEGGQRVEATTSRHQSSDLELLTPETLQELQQQHISLEDYAHCTLSKCVSVLLVYIVRDLPILCKSRHSAKAPFQFDPIATALNVAYSMTELLKVIVTVEKDVSGDMKQKSTVSIIVLILY